MSKDILNGNDNNSPLKVSFKTFGCRSNYADTVDLLALTAGRGASVSEFDDSSSSDADVVVINSCTVTDTADKESIKLISKLREKNPAQKIVFTGCMAEASPESILEKFPDISVLGPGQRINVVKEIFGESEKLNRPSLSKSSKVIRKPSHKTISLNDSLPEHLKGPGEKIGSFKMRSRFHLRVQEGCENHCTFCIIPKTRGLLSSRKVSDVLSDIKSLSELGFREIVLTGTHLGGYGLDLNSSLKCLLEEIEGYIEADLELNKPRIRLSSLDPDDVSCEMIDFLSKSHNFCKHLHICLQAFTNSILKRMNRKYRLEDAKDLLWYIHERYEARGVSCGIGSDVITGFPGECRKELEEGIESFLSLPISYLHVFPYSEREGTAATRLDGEIPISERKRRSARWRAISERKNLEFLQSLIGKNLEVVVEDRVLGDGSKLGTSSEFATVNILPKKISQSTTSSNIINSEELEYKFLNNHLTPGSLINVQAIGLDSLERRLICEQLN